MDIQLEKKELMKLLQETENPSIIKSIQKIFQKDKNDWWDDLPNSAKEGIKEGIVDIKNGRIHSYEEVKKEFENYINYKIKRPVISHHCIERMHNQLTYEFNDFRKFNILNLKEGVKEKPRNVGPSVTYKIRNNSGQAREYISYQVPMLIDERPFFISGMRETPQEEFKYLKIPADKKGSIAEFISFKEALQNKILIEMVAKKMANRSVKSNNNMSVKQSFEDSVNKIMTLFVEGGFSKIAQNIDNNIPANEKEKAVQAYLKIIDIASIELYKNHFSLSDKEIDQSAIRFIQEALNAYSDMFLFGTPYYFELTNYEHKEASGLQLTKSPGQFWVYLGSLSLVLGIFSMIYLHERKLWLLIKAKGGAIIAVSSNRKNIDFELDYKKVSLAIKKIIQ